MCRIEKNPIMISPFCIFEIDKLAHTGIFLILNINRIFNIIYPSTAKAAWPFYLKFNLSKTIYFLKRT